MAEKLKEDNVPVFIPGERSTIARSVRKMCSGKKKTPYLAQMEVICAIIKGFFLKRALAIVAEMGCGKSLMAAFVVWCLRMVLGHTPRTLVLCPGTLISTWVREFEAIFGDTVKIVDMNGPDAISLLSGLREEPVIPEKPEVWICGLYRMKTAAQWRASYFVKRTWERTDYEDEYGTLHQNAVVKVETPICPRCSEPLLNLTKTRRNRCPKCHEPLWGPVNHNGGLAGAIGKKSGESRTSRPSERAYAPVNYIRKFLPGHFHLLLVDEVHKCKGSATIQGAVLGQLASAIEKSLVLTGTLSGGKASDIFSLLQRVFALNYSKGERRRRLPHYHGLTEFVEEYGCLERVHTQFDDDPVTGRATPDERHVIERPGLSPQIFRRFFADCCAFMRIADIASEMPGYEEILEIIPMDDEVKEAYEKFEPELRREVSAALYKGDSKVLGQMIHSLLAYPDMPQKEVQVLNRDYDVVATAPSLDIEMTAKDRRLVEIVQDAKDRGRQVLIYAEYTGKWKADHHLVQFLESAGLRPLILNSGANDRLEWIERMMGTGNYDCCITHVKKVELGLNLYNFPTIVFWQTTQSVYMLRQACRRSWRPGQTEDVEVYFLINEGTMQEKQMSLIASKLHAALILEGELTENGLVALSNLGDSMTIELAKALVGELEVGSLEETFRMYRNADIAATTGIGLDGQAAKVVRFSAATAKRIGAICGWENQLLEGYFQGCRIQARPTRYGTYEIVLNGKMAGMWTGDLQDAVLVLPKGKNTQPLLVQPQPTFPGMVNLTVFRLPAAA